MRAKSMLRPSMRGGVPVLSLPCPKLSSFNLSANLIEAGSPTRPPVVFSKPTWIFPPKKVPAVSTMHVALI